MFVQSVSRSSSGQNSKTELSELLDVRLDALPLQEIEVGKQVDLLQRVKDVVGDGNARPDAAVLRGYPTVDAVSPPRRAPS